MPDHCYTVVEVTTVITVGATLAVVLHNSLNIANGAMTANRATARVAPTMGDRIGAYKSSVMNTCLEKSQ